MCALVFRDLTGKLCVLDATLKNVVLCFIGLYKVAASVLVD